MEKLYGRKKELNLLNKRFNSDNFEFGYLYGQRRIGKSSLLSMFTKNKKSIIFYASDSADIDIRQSFSNTLNEALGYSNSIYTDWYSFFEALDKFCGNDKVVICIDEFSNIIIGREGKERKLTLIHAYKKL